MIKLFYTNKQIKSSVIVKGSHNIVIGQVKGKSKRRLVKCQEDEEEQPVVVRGEAEDALFEE